MELQRHPIFDNLLILGKIVDYLSPSCDELKQLRQVSKSFREATLLNWRKSAAVFRIKSEKFSRIASCILNEESSVISSDDVFIYKFTKMPFTSYKFIGFEVDSRFFSQTRGYMKEFWTKIGSEIEDISFEKCTFNAMRKEPILQLLDSILPKLKNVVVTETVNVKNTVLNNIKRNVNSSSSVEVGENGFHQEQQYQIKYSNLRLVSYDGKEIDLIRQDDQLRRFVKIKQLDLMEAGFFLKYDYHENLEVGKDLVAGGEAVVPVCQLVSKFMCLEYLSVNLRPYLWETYKNNPQMRGWDGNIDPFFETMSATLKNLKIFRAPLTKVVPEPFRMPFLNGTKMSVLEEICLYGTIVTNLTFLKSMPNLVKLTIDRECFVYRKMIKEIMIGIWNEFKISLWYEKHCTDLVLMTSLMTDDIFCKNLRHIEIDCEFSLSSLQKLGTWMPFIRILKTILSCKTVAAVCEIWPQLEQLACMFGSILNEECFMLSKNPQRKPIWNLRDLVKIKYDTYCYSSELGDDVIWNGLLKMPKLKAVEICISSKMSNKAMSALENSVESCKFFLRCPDAIICGYENGCERCNFSRRF